MGIFHGPRITWMLFYFHVLIAATPISFILSNNLWALIHEGIHDNLPRWKSRILCAIFGFPFSVARHYHLKHHAENRIVERIEESHPLKYHTQLFGGLYFMELLSSIVYLRRYPLDCLLTLGFQILIFSQVSPWWIFLRAFLISSADYVYHFRGERKLAQGYNLKLPLTLQAYLLNFNLHGAHHARPSKPWYELEARCDTSWFKAFFLQFRQKAV